MSMDPQELRTAEDVFERYGQRGYDLWMAGESPNKPASKFERQLKGKQKQSLNNYKRKLKSEAEHHYRLNLMRKDELSHHTHKDNGKGFCKVCGKDMTRK